MLSTIFAPAIFAIKELPAGRAKEWDRNVVHLDLNLYRESDSGFEYVSRTSQRVIKLDSRLNNSNLGYQIALPRREALSIKPVSVLPEWVQRADNSIAMVPMSPLFTSDMTRGIQLDGDPAGKTTADFRQNFYSLTLISTLSGVKEIITLKRRPEGLRSDLIVTAVIRYNGEDYNVIFNAIEDDERDILSGVSVSNEPIELVEAKTGRVVYTIPSPLIYDSPEIIMTERGPLYVGESRHFKNLTHRCILKENMIIYKIIVPYDFLLSPETRYPVYIDPSVNVYNGTTEYIGYDNGTVLVRAGGEEHWYPDVNRTVYVESDVHIGLGERLTFTNINLKVNRTGVKIVAGNGGELNFYQNTVVTTTTNSSGYTIIYEGGSRGNIYGSTIEKAKSGNGVEIRSSSVSIANSVLRDNNIASLYINQSSPEIIASELYGSKIGLLISPYSNPEVVGNRISGEDAGVVWESANVYETFDELSGVERLIGARLEDGDIVPSDINGNLALFCEEVEVDSECDEENYGKWRLNNGIKGNINDEWISEGTAEPHWIVYYFESPKNITRFVLYHDEMYPTRSFQIQTWHDGAWTTRFEVSSNSERVTYHNLTNPITTTKVRLYITDSNINHDTKARIEEFEVYTNEALEDVHYVITRERKLYGDTIYGRLRTIYEKPEGTDVLVDVLNGKDNTTIEGYEYINSADIDLREIDTIRNPSVKFKFELLASPSSVPVLKGYELYFTPYRGLTYDFVDEREIVSLDSAELVGGKLQAKSRYRVREWWEDGWRSNWTVTKKQDEGYVEVVENHWPNSFKDMYLEGTSNGTTSNHDGWVSLSRIFENVSSRDIIQTRFSGRIDNYIYNMADVLITIYNRTYEQYKRIWWTTRDYSYNTGLSADGNTYYIVAQDDDPTAPYEYEVELNIALRNLFGSYFGEDEINWSDYIHLEFKAYSIENYQWEYHNNPKVYVDYFILITRGENSTICEEWWEDGWRSNWTVTKKQDEGYVEVVENHWPNSFKDMYLEGTSNGTSNNHDGWVSLSRIFENISSSYIIQTRFSGRIDDYIYNMADVLITIYSKDYSSYKRIRWTTRAYSYNTGLSADGNTYYIVAQDYDHDAPYEYEEDINMSIRDLYEQYFGVGVINWSEYVHLEFKVYSIENYQLAYHNNPKVYIDYFVLDRNRYGEALLKDVQKNAGESWAYLVVKSRRIIEGDVKLTLMKDNGTTVIDGFANLTDEYIDITPLNELQVTRFWIWVRVYAEETMMPTVDWIKVYKTTKFEENEIFDSGKGVEMYDINPLIQNNEIYNNSVGLVLCENRTGPGRSNVYLYMVSDNTFRQNGRSLVVKNTSAFITSSDMIGNEMGLTCSYSYVKLSSCWMEDEGGASYFNYSVVELIDTTYSDSIFELKLKGTEATMMNMSFMNNVVNRVTLNCSNVTFIDTWYSNISMYYQDNTSSVIIKWDVDLELKDLLGEVYNDVAITIYDVNGNTLGNWYSNNEGLVENIRLVERIMKRNGVTIMNPYKFWIHGFLFSSTVEVNVMEEAMLTVRPYMDADGDGLKDYEEQNWDLHPFSGTSLAFTEDQHMEYWGDMWTTNKGMRLIDKELLNVSEGSYKIHLLGRCAEGITAEINVRALSGGVEACNESMKLDDEIRLSSTSIFYFPGGVFRLNISCPQPISDRSVWIYRVWLERVNDSFEEGLRDPMIADIDKDGILDGDETWEDVIFVEAEELVLQNTQIRDVEDASNRSAGAALSNHTIIDRVIETPTGRYRVYVKIKSGGSSEKRFRVILNGGESDKNITGRPYWQWYDAGIGSSISGGIRVYISEYAGANVWVDKIMLVRERNSSERETFLSDMYDCSNEIPQGKRVVYNLQWLNYLGNGVGGRAAVSVDALYFVRMNGSVVKVDRESGEVLLDRVLRSDNYDYVLGPEIAGEFGLVYLLKENFLSKTGYIVGFYTSNLTQAYVITLPNKDVKNSGIVISQGRFYYTTSFGEIVCRDLYNGSLLWRYEADINATLTRPTIDEASQTLFAGGPGRLYKVEFIYSSQSDIQVTRYNLTYNLTNPILVRSLQELYTVSALGEVLRINPIDDAVDLVINCSVEVSGTHPILEYPVLYFTSSNGALFSVMLFPEPFMLEIDAAFESQKHIYVSENNLYAVRGNEIFEIEKNYFKTVVKHTFGKAVNSTVLVGDEFYVVLTDGLVYKYGRKATDILDSDLDSDGCRDGKELDGNFRKILIEAEDYYNHYSVGYNVTSITMYATCDNDRYDIGYPNAGTFSYTNYTVDIDRSGMYSIVVRARPNILLDPYYSMNTSGSSSAYITYDREYILKALEISFWVEIEGEDGAVSYLMEKGYWGHGGGLKTNKMTTEVIGGGGGYIWEGIYYLSRGKHNVKLKIEILDENNEPKQVYIPYAPDVFYLVGENATIDNIIIRAKSLSILDSDSDNDTLLDGYEVRNGMFPLNSDPDMDGISDYYEVVGVNITLPGGGTYNYGPTDFMCRDTDRDGVRDRVELGMSVNDTDPYTEYDTRGSIASAYERAVRGLQPYQCVSNSDADTDTITNPRDYDTDDDGLPDGVMDGIVYEPLYSQTGSYGPDGLDGWTFRAVRMNNIIEFWEGEDFDLDGARDTNGSWAWNLSNLEHVGEETSPVDDDTDGDGLPDGWEAWYTLNPCDPEDAERDVDFSTNPVDDCPWVFSSYYFQNRAGDNLTNIEEYLLGTSPVTKDTDRDGMEDGDECLDDNYILLKTTVERGAISGEHYGEGSDEYIWYGGDWYEYHETIWLDGKKYLMMYPKNLTEASESNAFLTYLYDGTEILFNTTTEEIYVLKSLSILTDTNDDGFVDLKCIVYTQRSSGVTLPERRYRILCQADPLKKDTDGDGLMDGEEYWVVNNTIYTCFNNVDNDSYLGVRDVDSDNDGVEDGKEINYYFQYNKDYSNTTKVIVEDIDGDNFPNVLDPDSDGDRIKDGDECLIGGVPGYMRDLDGDGFSCMMDIDSDGDGIPDGWVDGYVYDPTQSIRRGAFYHIDEAKQNNVSDAGEGEDLDCDGEIDGDTNGNRVIDENETFTETDPYHPDTDRDLLIDGYTPSYEPIVRRFAERYGDLLVGEKNVTLGSLTCNELDNDTDDDGLLDGAEVNGWQITYMTVDGENITARVYSNPLLNDTDGDSMKDEEEYGRYDGNDDDTDRDNLTDLYEIAHGLDPLRQDSDGDHVPDGWIDIDGDGEIEMGEYEKYPNNLTNYTDPLDPDTDNDGLLDGVEEAFLEFRTNAEDGIYYKKGTWIYMDPGLGKRYVFWYYENVSTSSLDPELSEHIKLPVQTYDGKDIYACLVINETHTEIVLNASIVKYILVHESDNGIVYKYLPQEDYFRELDIYGELNEFLRDYSPAYTLPYRSYKYSSKEVCGSISNVLDNDTDGDNLTDWEEYKELCGGNILHLLRDYDNDENLTLRDNDSDGDGINDSDDLYLEINNVWIPYYYGDPDGDGLPNALDGDSDNDERKDGVEDSNHNGKVDEGETDPMSNDTDHDGINDDVEKCYQLNSRESDTDEDGIIDGLDGPNGRWWLDIDHDGNISANDVDSDGDGLQDGYEDKNHDGKVDENETSPWSADTDNDGLWDGENVTLYGRNTTEVYYFMDGIKRSMNINWSKGYVVMVGEKSIGTDPLNPDSDGDGLFDGEEVYGFAECGVVLNRFEEMKDGYLRGPGMRIPIPLPGEYILAVKKIGNDILELKVQNETGCPLGNIKFETYEYTDRVYLGYIDNITEYSLNVVYRPRGVIIKGVYLMRKGLDPLMADTDMDNLTDGEEVYGKYGFSTHPLAVDSDADGLSDFEELYYRYAKEDMRGITLNPLDPDVDRDEIPDGYDMEPLTRYELDWEDHIMPFSLNDTMGVEVLYVVGETEGAYSSKYVKDGRIKEGNIGDVLKEALDGYYVIIDYWNLTDPHFIEKKKYTMAGITYSVYSQFVTVRYTNPEPLYTPTTQATFVLRFDETSDYRVVMRIAVKKDVFRASSLNQTVRISGRYSIYNEYYRRWGRVWMSAPDIYHSGLEIRKICDVYDYYGGESIYELSLYIPKSVIEEGKDAWGDNGKELVLHLSLNARVMEDKRVVETRYIGYPRVGNMFIQKMNGTVWMISKPDYPIFRLEKALEESEIDLGVISGNKQIMVDEGIIWLLDCRDDHKREENEEILERIRKDEIEGLKGVVILVEDRLKLSELIMNKPWSPTWNMTDSISDEYTTIENLMVNKKVETTSEPIWLKEGNRFTGVMSSSKGALKVAIKTSELISYFRFDPLFFEVNAMSFSSIWSRIGGAELLTMDSMMFAEEWAGMGVKKLTLRQVHYESIFGVDIPGDNAFEASLYESDTLEAMLVESGGIRKFYERLELVTNGLDLALDVASVVSDGYTMYRAISNGADEVEISILAVSVAVKSVKVIYDAKVFIGSLRTIGKVRSVAVEMGPNPAVVAIEVAVGVVEIGRLLWERHKATNWIQAHALEEEAYEVYVDMVMGIVGMFFPIGTIIWVVYEGVKVFMEYVGWADDIKNFYFNFFLGRVTAQQEAEAYESICTYLNETAVERSEMFKGEGRIAISVPWPPDISR